MTEVLSEGKPTGEFTAILTSSRKGEAEITGSIAGKFISDFVDTYDDDYQIPHLEKRVITVNFIDSVDNRVKKVDRTEPLGK